MPLGRKRDYLTKIQLFEELANIDENGFSRWVYTTEFVGKYQSLQLLNGSGWARNDGAFGKKYIIEKDYSITPGNKIDAIRTCGFNKAPKTTQNIRSDIYTFYQNKPSALSGVFEKNRMEIDHKNGRKDNLRVMNIATQTVDDFMPLTKSENDMKRQKCKECKRSGCRFKATTLGYPIDYWYGDSIRPDSPDGCIGCFLYDPIEFREHLTRK